MYAEAELEDNKTMQFDILGKFGNNYLVFKNIRNICHIAVYNESMKLTNKVQLSFIPDRLLDVETITYKEYAYIFYQYQKRNIAYCMAVKIDGEGKPVGDAIQLDTTDISFNANNKMYNVIFSEDKQKIMVTKLNSRNEKSYLLVTSLFNKELNLIQKARMRLQMPDRNDFLNELSIDNEGNLLILRATGTAQKDNITGINLLIKFASNDSLSTYPILLPKLYLDQPRIKINNSSKEYLVISYFSKTRRGNIDGLFTVLWNSTVKSARITAINNFTDEFRNDAKGDASLKTAFNEFYIREILMRKDGGFAIAAEATYNSSRNNGFNRWDNLSMSPMWGGADYYSFNQFNNTFPWRFNSFNQTIRYFADNIALVSFDSTCKLEWANVVRKSQFDDNSDALIGYGTHNAGGEVHFIFNQLERRNYLLTDQSVNANGQITRNPTIKNLDKGFDFMPRFAKQVSSRQMIIPCQYRNLISFARIEF